MGLSWEGGVEVEGRVHPRVARRERKVTEIPAEGGLDQTFTHPHPSLLLSLFHQKTFLCTLIQKSEINKAGTHLNKCAEMPVDSKTPSDRQASFKSTPQSTQNAFFGGGVGVCFIQLLYRGDDARCPGRGEFRNSARKKMSRAAPPGRKNLLV